MAELLAVLSVLCAFFGSFGGLATLGSLMSSSQDKSTMRLGVFWLIMWVLAIVFMAIANRINPQMF